MPAPAPQPKPLAEIVRELKQRHDASANFRLIFERYYGAVRRFFQRKGIPPEDCRDLSQETFLAAYRSLANLQDEEHFEAWLFGIARNTYRADLERRLANKRMGVRVFPQSGPSGETVSRDFEDRSRSADILKTVLDRERLEQLIAAFREMPGQMRRCLELRVVSDSSYHDIATIMGISINTVKAHLHKAKKELQQKLSPYFANFEV